MNPRKVSTTSSAGGLRRFQSKQPPKPAGRKAVNFLGILSAFAIAFGGLFLVQGRLRLEQDQILKSGGLVELPQAGAAEAIDSAYVTLGQRLAEEELFQLIDSLEQREEIRPHEPLEGQLSMIQAISHGEAWLEEFILPYLASDALTATEYRASCYLWTPEAAGTDTDSAPWLDCWTVSLTKPDIDATLTLSAVSGQILEASISCSAWASAQKDENMLTLFDRYASSFGLEEGDSLIFIQDKDSPTHSQICYQSIGTRGICAAMETGNVVLTATDTDTDTPLYMERFSLRLYLSKEPVIH